MSKQDRKLAHKLVQFIEDNVRTTGAYRREDEWHDGYVRAWQDVSQIIMDHFDFEKDDDPLEQLIINKNKDN